MTPASTLVRAVPDALLTVARQAPDPEDVKPGWLAFVVFLLLAVAVVFLAFSFVKQLRKVNFEEQPDGEQGKHLGPGEGKERGASGNGRPADSD